MKYRNSDFIVPISIFLHLCIINGVLFILTPETYLNVFNIAYYNFSWLFIAFILNYYTTERKELFFTRFHKIIQILFVYFLAYFALFAILDESVPSVQYQYLVYAILAICLICYRVLFFWVRGKFRVIGRNSVKVIVLGRDRNLKKIRKVFDNPTFGYHYAGYFSDRDSKSLTYLGQINESFGYILNYDIDIIYCVASNFSEEELKNFVNFADNNLIRFKVILDDMDVFNRAMSVETYNNIPVLNLRNVPLDTEYARIIKRAFDIVFSSLVILLLLSWLTPILYILIKLDSPGDFYFKQLRHGYKRQTFWCYKYRSMTVNKESDSQMAKKGDMRVTRIGKFIRKTSIDELPQFINVFKGDMSIVGPRPHMVLHTSDYEKSVDKYLVRHFVKPGITGLAQIKGYRGEIINSSDIKNRTRLDIFYVERWSVGLDLHILFYTIYNVIKGEEKAY
ncbi:putative colanic acid biosynthesis UDP-glucose lipid carrier transferase [Maribacter spongiicola]|uniref:Putative colanic acid biosynthesis UDP-glucose lipid carrier transferase n=1 Tax=Maribacter spongiicola TaxID=1206753 RepID=A0A4R7K622_9FLAO|nr:exopolysaccharide biosynthesis polyprenyl glycosylphosphotransferase [Maribacter spongiicola]TDT46705.1 putative colanic acid biosynthesis UDP-glucose lipid carrier transferase [Maribacter spongiicola]